MGFVMIAVIVKIDGKFVGGVLGKEVKVGTADGDLDGFRDGDIDGYWDGELVGCLEGDCDGEIDGEKEGRLDGNTDDSSVG